MEMEILILVSSYTNTMEKGELTASVCILRDFQNHKYRFTIMKPRIRLAEKREEEEEHRPLQSVMHFTQTQ